MGWGLLFDSRGKILKHFQIPLIWVDNFLLSVDIRAIREKYNTSHQKNEFSQITQICADPFLSVDFCAICEK